MKLIEDIWNEKKNICWKFNVFFFKIIFNGKNILECVFYMKFFLFKDVYVVFLLRSKYIDMNLIRVYFDFLWMLGV